MKMKAFFPANLVNAPAIRGMTLAFVLGMATIAQADPLSIYDEDMTATLILQECKVGDSELFRKYPMPGPKVRAIGDAAWHQLWDALDKQDAAHHDENARKADFELKQRSVADLAHARDLVATQGCDALVPHARAVTEKSLQ